MIAEAYRVATRPTLKPPLDGRIGGDTTPIAALTGMRTPAWLHWLSRGGADSYGTRCPRETALIIDGILNGIDVDFEGDRSVARWARNLPIRPEDKAKVQKVIDADVAAGKKAGPFVHAPCSNFVVSPIGAVPKKDLGKIRVIHHLSFPFKGNSVNAGVVDEPMTLGSVDAACAAIVRFGRGCFLIKLDVEAAYKQVPVRPGDWHLLGFMWEGKYYYERVLPFGLKSSCRLWELYAAALHDFFARRLCVPVVIHYIDDFLFVVELKPQAEQLLTLALGMCRDLGIPMAADKTEGPTTCLTFLGIELDTERMEARLPGAKLLELQALSFVWARKERATVRELQSLTGSLNFATSVVRPGRAYLRRIINHMKRQRRDAASRHVEWDIPPDVKADIAWWREFIAEWNGVSLFYELEWRDAEFIELYTDACNTGFGACYGNAWFGGEWSAAELASALRVTRLSMPFLELRALVLAAATWGHTWTGKRITFRSDCESAVNAVNNLTSTIDEMQHQIRHLTMLACRHGFEFRCRHVPGVANVIADVLSRGGGYQEIRARRPDTAWEQVATPVPPLPLPALRRAASPPPPSA
jgi:hypothetical protein